MGQVFTPNWVVELILKSVEFNGSGNFKILEPAAGDGAFVIPVIEKIIDSNKNKTKAEVFKIINESVWAFELDEVHFETLNSKISSLIEEKLGLKNKHLKNLYNTDTLFFDFKKNKFDFIVGNPPYIRRHNLPEDYANKLRAKFSSCEDGNFDIYYAFYELGFNLLADNGKLSFIAPNAFFTTSSALNLRNLLQNNIFEIYDFEAHQVFDKISTYTAIVSISQNKANEVSLFRLGTNKHFKEVNKTSEIRVNKNIWTLPSREEERILNSQDKRKTAISDIVEIKNGLATLSDDIFFTTDFKEQDNFFIFNGFKIEKEFIRPVVKVSTFTKDIKQIGIFPYKIVNGQVERMTISELKKHKHLYKYLFANKERLEKRSLESKANWWEYGRSQGLTDILKPKVIIKTLIKDKVEFKRIPKNVLVYSGLYAIGELSKLEEILPRKELVTFLRLYGGDKSGGYKATRTKDIKNYKFK